MFFFQPLIGHTHGAIVCVTKEVGDDQGVVRQRFGREIACKFCKGRHLFLVRSTVHHIAIPRHGVVPLHVLTTTAAHEPGLGERLGIQLPRHTRLVEFTEDVVARYDVRTSTSRTAVGMLATARR